MEFLTAATQGITKFDNKSIDTQDVTEKHTDLSVQIKNMKALEQRFIKLLSRANRVSEVLEIEREIARLRTQIERFERQLKHLDKPS